MTSPAPATIEREMPLHVTDAQLIAAIGLSPQRGRLVLIEWELDPTFPKPDKFLEGKRYWPGVKAWIDARNNGKVAAPPSPRRVVLDHRFGARRGTS